MKKLTLAMILLVLMAASAFSDTFPLGKFHVKNTDPLGVAQALKNETHISLMLFDECNSVYDDTKPTNGSIELKEEMTLDYYAEMERLLAQQTCLALATCVNKCPNVRIVNFVNLEKQPGVLYFVTSPDMGKVKELKHNSRVAFTTIPGGGMEHVRAIAEVRRSNKTVFDLQDVFAAKIKGYEQIIQTSGDTLMLFEIHFSRACVILDRDHMKTVQISDHSTQSQK